MRPARGSTAVAGQWYFMGRWRSNARNRPSAAVPMGRDMDIGRTMDGGEGWKGAWMGVELSVVEASWKESGLVEG